MPPKGSNAKNLKHGYLGQLQPGKTVVKTMETKIQDQKEEIFCQRTDNFATTVTNITERRNNSKAKTSRVSS